MLLDPQERLMSAHPAAAGYLALRFKKPKYLPLALQCPVAAEGKSVE